MIISACTFNPALQITGLIWSWLHFLPLLAGFCVVIYLLWTGATSEQRISLMRSIKNWGTTKPASPSSKKTRSEGRVVVAAIGRVFLPLLTFALGFLYSEHRHSEQIYPFKGMQIIRKYDSHHYQVRFVDDKLPWDIHICKFPGNDIDWDEGMTIDGAYEDTGGCKNFGVHGAWFLVNRNPLTSKFIDYRSNQ